MAVTATLTRLLGGAPKLAQAPASEPAPPPAPSAPASLAAFVRDRLGALPHTKRAHRLGGWSAYYDGKQFEGRPYDEHGCWPGSFGLAGGPEGFASWSKRQVRAVNNVARDVVEQLTQWSVVGTSWCALRVPGDDAATEWLEGLAKESYFARACALAVSTAGGCGAAAVSASWRGGRVHFEAHRPEHVWPLAWADERDLVPLEVVKVFHRPDPYARHDAKGPGENGPFTLRYWSGRLPDGTPGVEAYFVAWKDEFGWRLAPLGEPVAHGSERCPVFWVPRGETREECGFDGEPFFAGSEGLVDASNELEQAGDNTSKRNADDTLVVKEDPDKAPRVLRKGALGAIFAKGGAEYLSQKGDSAKVLYELGERREAQAYRAAHVIKVDVETLSRQTTGESLKRLYFTMLNEADEVRVWVERYFVVPAAEWMLRTSRDRLAGGAPVVMPPVEEDGEPGQDGEATKVVRARAPGQGEAVVVTWPQAFPPTIDDLKAGSEAVKNAVGAGAMSRETAVRVLARAGAPVESVEAELERLRQDADEKAEQSAKGLGLAAEATAAVKEEKAGPVDG